MVEKIITGMRINMRNQGRIQFSTKHLKLKKNEKVIQILDENNGYGFQLLIEDVKEILENDF